MHMYIFCTLRVYVFCNMEVYMCVCTYKANYYVLLALWGIAAIKMRMCTFMCGSQVLGMALQDVCTYIYTQRIQLAMLWCKV